MKKIIKIYFMKTIFKVVQVREQKITYSALCLNLSLDTFVTEFFHLEKKREAGV